MSFQNRNFKRLTLFKNRELQQNIKDLDRTLEIDPDDLTGLRNKGIVLVNLNKYEEAIKVIDRVLSLDPNDSEILLFKAIALESQGLDGEKFIQFYEKSMKNDEKR